MFSASRNWARRFTWRKPARKRAPSSAPISIGISAPKSPRGPGKNAAIFSNCERLEIFIDGQSRGVALPDRKNYSHLPHPPFFCDLDMSSIHHPELRIDGYVGGSLVLSKSFSSDNAQDLLFLAADDAELSGDGSDATRVVFKVTDKFGRGSGVCRRQRRLCADGAGDYCGRQPV